MTTKFKLEPSLAWLEGELELFSGVRVTRVREDSRLEATRTDLHIDLPCEEEGRFFHLEVREEVCAALLMGATHTYLETLMEIALCYELHPVFQYKEDVLTSEKEIDIVCPSIKSLEKA